MIGLIMRKSKFVIFSSLQNSSIDVLTLDLVN